MEEEKEEAESPQALLRDCLEALGVTRMVVGHTPQVKGKKKNVEKKKAEREGKTREKN